MALGDRAVRRDPSPVSQIAKRTIAGDTRRELVVDGARVVAYERGAGEPCLLLHGYPQNHTCWRRVVDSLARTHRAIAVDWPGWGESIGGAELGAKYDDEAARIGKILDALEIEGVNLFAHDYGGHLALGFAARNTHRLLRLAILNSRAQATFPRRWYLQFSAMSAMARTAGLDRAMAALPLYETHRNSLKRYVLNGSFSSDELDGYIGFLRTTAGRRRFVRFFRDYQTRVRGELPGACRLIDVPTAVIYGDRDPYCPFSIAEELTGLLPRATLVRITDGDHYIMEERPAEVVAALHALLADESAPRAARIG